MSRLQTQCLGRYYDDSHAFSLGTPGLSLGSRPTEGQALILKFNLVSQDLGPGNSYISC